MARRKPEKKPLSSWLTILLGVISFLLFITTIILLAENSQCQKTIKILLAQKVKQRIKVEIMENELSQAKKKIIALDLYFQAARGFKNRHDQEQTIKILNQSLEIFPTPEAYSLRAEYYFCQNDFFPGLKDKEKAIELCRGLPGKSEAIEYIELGDFYHFYIGDTKKAIRCYQIAGEKNEPDSITGTALALYYQKKYQEAETLLTRIKKVNLPWHLLFILGNIYYQAGNYYLAVPTYEKAMLLLFESKYIPIFLNCGSAYAFLKKHDACAHMYYLVWMIRRTGEDRYRYLKAIELSHREH